MDFNTALNAVTTLVQTFDWIIALGVVLGGGAMVVRQISKSGK